MIILAKHNFLELFKIKTNFRHASRVFRGGCFTPGMNWGLIKKKIFSRHTIPPGMNWEIQPGRCAGRVRRSGRPGASSPEGLTDTTALSSRRAGPAGQGRESRDIWFPPSCRRRTGPTSGLNQGGATLGKKFPEPFQGKRETQ